MLLKTLVTFINFASNLNEKIVFAIGVITIVVPITTKVTCVLAIGNKVLFEIVSSKNILKGKDSEKEQAESNSFDKSIENVKSREGDQKKSKLFVKFSIDRSLKHRSLNAP